jgi:hypothetical protein
MIVALPLPAGLDRENFRKHYLGRAEAAKKWRTPNGGR